MRPLLYFALGMALACLGRGYGVIPAFYTILTGITGLAMGVLCYRKKMCSIRLPVVFLGIFLGAMWFSLFEGCYLRPLQGMEGKTAHLQVSITSPPAPGKTGCSAEGMVRFRGRLYRVRAYFKDGQDLQAGDMAEGEFSLRPTRDEYGKPMGSNSGEGIHLMLFEKEDVIIRTRENCPWWAIPGRLRAYAEKLIPWCFSQKAAPFARALLLGDSESLDFETRWILRKGGISHMVAVSGLHVSVLCMLLSFLVLKNRWASALVGIPILLIFGAMTGFPSSVVRACIMMTLLLLSHLFLRRYDPMSELAAAVSIMLLLNPLTVTSVGFQLSVCSVLGIFCFFGPIQVWMLKHFKKYKDFREKLVHWFCGSVGLSLSALIFVTPLAAVYFGAISLAAPLVNLLTVFIITPIFWGILLVLALGAISLTAAQGLGAILSLLIAYVLKTAEILGKLPLSGLYMEAWPMMVWLISLYGLGLWLLRGGSKNVTYFAEFSAVGLLIALVLSWTLPLRNQVYIRVFDVGQGQCILLQCRDKNYLVDCGGDREEGIALEAGNLLLSQGISRLDGLILTHGDRDHVGAADELLTMVDAERIYVPEIPVGQWDPRLQTVAGERDLPVPGGILRIFGPDFVGPANEMSLCVLLDSKEYDILITGDRSRKGELALLRNHSLPKVNCLVAGHHGAADSTCQELLDRVRPDTVIISAGRHNSYGHPAGETLLRLQKFGCQVLRTDQNGSIIIKR